MTLAQNWLMTRVSECKHRLGLDDAITYTVLARASSIIGSVGTVLLIVHYLNPVEQGYYYTLLSLLNLQIVFELGFSFVIQQFAAHESAHLRLYADGRIEGDPVSHARLASIFRKTIRWYAGAAALLALTLIPAGVIFFSRHSHADDHVAWQAPWIITAAACAVLFFLNPFSCFLDGCGQVRQVAGMRFAQASLGIIGAWGSLIAHHGLYSPALVILAYAVVAVVFLWTRRRLLLGLFLYRSGTDEVSWRTEVWSFQWKLGIASLCSYFTVQVFTPALFAFRGPAEAGMMGMSLSITAYLWTVVLAWTSTKATPFGQMIARREFDRLAQSYFRTLRQSLVVLTALVMLCMAGILAVQHLSPRLAARMVSPPLFALLLVTALSTLVVQSQAIYLRAHKREPFLFQSSIVALFTLAGVYLLIPRWGVVGSTVTYFVCSGVVGLGLATVIFQKWRKVEHETCRVPMAALEL
jgi:O-antigen/teichoic acid export membrane protein